MTDGNSLIVFDGPPAPAPEPGPAGHDPGSDNTSAELVAAHHFVNSADTRDPQTAQIAAEINAMLQAGASGDGDDGYAFGEDQSGRPRDAQGRYVPHAAMHQERERRKAAEAKAHALEIQMAKAEERLQLLNDLAYGPQGQQQQQPQARRDPDADVDPETDIFEAVRRLQKQTAKQKQAETNVQLNRAYQQDALRFKEKHPDLVEAYQHLAASRDRELAIMGMTDAAQRKAQVLAEEQSLVLRALQAGESPTKILYDLAVSKGWSPHGAGAQHVWVPDSRAVEHVQNLQRGQAASASLTGAGGSAGAGLTVAQIANMPDDQFERLINKMGGLGDDRVKRAFGG